MAQKLSIVDAPCEKVLRFFRDFTLSPVPDPLTVFASLIYESSEPVVVPWIAPKL